MHEGERVLVMREFITCRVSPAASEGRLLVVEAEVPPQGGPPPLHRHAPDEVFHVIEGRITLYVDAIGTIEARDLNVGETDFVSGGTPHTFRNFTNRPARLLLTFSPGEMMAAFFTGTGRPLTDGAPAPDFDPDAEVERVLRLGSALGLETLERVPT